MQTDPAKDPYLFDDAEPGVIGTSLKMREMRSSSRDGKPFAAGRTVREYCVLLTITVVKDLGCSLI